MTGVPRWVGFLLIIPALLLSLFLALLLVLLLSFFPPVISAVAFGLMAVIGLWVYLARRRKTAGPVSELSLMGRQTSKDGLL